MLACVVFVKFASWKSRIGRDFECRFCHILELLLLLFLSLKDRRRHLDIIITVSEILVAVPLFEFLTLRI